MDREDTLQGLWQLRDRDLALVVSLLAAQAIDLRKSPETALRWCTERAEAGDPKAQHALAKLLWTGLAGTRNDELAFQWCCQASDQGYLPAIVMLAGLYSSGIGVAADMSKSVELLRSAVTSGSTDAMSLLGALYAEGFGVERDLAQAMQLWRSAAELDNPDAQYNLGSELMESTDIGEASEGVKWLRAAAKQGHYSAHYAIASLYEKGSAGLPKDEGLAEHHRALASKLETGSG